MFKKNPPNVRLHAPVEGFATTVETVKDGNIVRSVVSTKAFKDQYPSIGSPDNYSLQRQLEAGIDLKRVNNNVLSPDMDEVVNHILSDKEENKNEE